MSKFDAFLEAFDDFVDDWMGITLHRPRRVFKGFTILPHCRWCGQIEQVDMCCGNKRIPWSRLYSLGCYEDPLSSAIRKGKLAKWESGLKHLGSMLGNKVKGSVPPDSIVTPVPMPSIRKFVRGIHHSSVIAKALAKRAELPYRQLLWRKGGRTQAGQSEAIRTQLQWSSMKLLPWTRNIKGMNIILVDDVLTTGRTLHVAVKHLRAGGARSIRVAVIATTKMPRKGQKK